MAQPITLINPKGERRDFGFVEFYGFKQQVANSQSFKDWPDEKFTLILQLGRIHAQHLCMSQRSIKILTN